MLFISHRFHEIEALADSISIFRNGTRVETFDNGAYDYGAIISKMVGQKIDDLFPPKHAPDPDAAEVLRLEGFGWTDTLHDVSIILRKGQMAGLGGLAGQGQGDVLQGLFGLLKGTRGQCLMGGEPVSIKNPRMAKSPQLSIALIPEDRKTEGLILDQSIARNLELAALGVSTIDATDAAIYRPFLDALELKCDSLDQPVSQLSGGNQQKVALTKWLALGPRCMLLAVMALTNCIASYLVIGSGIEMAFGIVVVVAAGIGCGLLNGLLVVYGRIQPIVATLATASLFVGLALLLRPTPGGQIDYDLADAMTLDVLGMPTALIITAAVILLIWVPLRRTGLGLGLYAVGSSEQGAFQSGMPVAKIRLASFAMGGFFAGLAGLYFSFVTTTGDVGIGPNFTLNSIAAVALGGVALRGGVGYNEKATFLSGVSTPSVIFAAFAIASGCTWTEGPVWLNDTPYFNDIPAKRMMKWSAAKGVTIALPNSEFANGDTLDLQGRMVSCEHGRRRVIRRLDLEDPDAIDVIADSYEGKRLNSPNDVVVRSDGSIWFTDPPYGINSDIEGYPAEPEQDGCYVFCASPDGTLTAVTTDFDKPNGLAFSKDETQLYIADSGAIRGACFPGIDTSLPHHIRIFDVNGTTLSNRRVFAEISPGVPDGFRIDHAGFVWTSALDGIHCLDREGRCLGEIQLLSQTSNICFSGAFATEMFITSLDTVWRLSSSRRDAAHAYLQGNEAIRETTHEH